jgi:hypothetical protein
MASNYDTSQVGVPYDRGYKITINYPDSGLPPSMEIVQGLAVKLADGSIRKLQELPTISRSIDLANAGNDPIPMVDPATGAPLGQNTTLNMTMLHLLACIRQEQTRVVA